MAIFTNDFEEGDFSAWTGTTGAPSVVHTVPHHNLHCAEAISGGAGDSDYCYKTFADETTLYSRFYVYIDDWVGNAADYFFLLLTQDTWTLRCALGITGATATLYFKYRAGGANNFITSATTLSNDQWYCIEVKFVKSVAAGEYRVYLDGVEVADLTVTGLDTSESGAGYVGVGNYDSWKTSITTRIDCVKIDTAYVGVEVAGGVTVKKGGAVPNTMATMLSSKMLFSHAKFPKFTPRIVT